MIINNSYFTGDIYIPHAKPSITDDVSGVENEILSFIEDYERECLLNCLGYELFIEFEKNLDSTQPDGLSGDADSKWHDLLNGKEYQYPDSGGTKIWRGLRYKSNPSKDYNKSLIAYYVYFFYERYDYITRSDAGHQQPESKNSERVSPTLKVVTAWNKFVDHVQGRENKPKVDFKSGYAIVDYFDPSVNLDVSLYDFIRNSNELQEDTYKGFKPKNWSRMNRYGI